MDTDQDEGLKILTRHSRMFAISGVCLVVAGLSPMLLLIQAGTQNGRVRTSGFVAAGVFWAGMIAGTILFVLTDVNRRKFETILRKNDFEPFSAGLPGMLVMFRYNESKICDVVWIISAIILVITIFAKVNRGTLIIVCVSVFITAFVLHCILNGKNYMYVKTYRKYKAEEESV